MGSEGRGREGRSGAQEQGTDPPIPILGYPRDFGKTRGNWGTADVFRLCVGDKDSGWEGSDCQWKEKYGWKGKGQEDVAAV